MERLSLDGRVRALVSAGSHDSAATEAIRALAPLALRYVGTILRSEDDAKDALSLWAEGVWKGLRRRAASRAPRDRARGA